LILYPRFLGIGAQKAGTTWLHAVLSAHRNLWLPHVKEVHYFDRKYSVSSGRKGSPNPARERAQSRFLSARLKKLSLAKLVERLRFKNWHYLAWECKYVFGRWDDQWYATLFDDAGDRIPGEITPAYSCLAEEAIANVHRLMPDVKLILLLRDPVERAWSHAKMDLAGSRAGRDASDAEYIRHFNSVESERRGDYPGMIDRWLAKFSREQLFIGFYDDIRADPQRLRSQILEFVGVSHDDSASRAAAERRFNVGTESQIPARFMIHLARKYAVNLRETASRYGGHSAHWLRRYESVLSGSESGISA
jgi:hypothetical protein